MYRILIVDDEPYVAEGLRVSLSEELDAELFELEAAFSAREALDRCRRRTFDIVVSDIRMPEMDGMSLQTCLREEFPACRVIFLTGHGDFALIRQAFRNHGTDYILKTEGDDQVLAAIYQTCTGLEAERAEQRQRLQEEVLLNRARAVIGQTLIAQIVSGDLTSAAGALEALGPDSLLPRKEGEFLVSVLRSDLPSASPDEAGYLELPIRLVEDSLMMAPGIRTTL